MPHPQPFLDDEPTDEVSRPKVWHVITCEYPPQSGGVSDYAYLLAKGLASHGDQVNVWCPAAIGNAPEIPGVHARQAMGRFSAIDLWKLGRRLDAFAKPRHLLVQWVPHGFGYKSVNLPFCAWLWLRAALRGDAIDVMVHEPFSPFRPGKWKQNAAAAVHRIMMRILLRSARRVCLSTPVWEKMIRPYDANRERNYEWLPLPSTVPTIDDPIARKRVKEQYCSGGVLLGHFGTFGPPITPMLRAIIPPLLRRAPGAAMVLIGPRSAAFRDVLLKDFPDIEAALFAIGQIDARDPRLSLHLSACDILLQPYPDGVTGRRTSMMAALAHGKPAVTTLGAFTESIWTEGGAVVLTSSEDMDAFVESAQKLIESAAARASLGEAARRFYQQNFAIEHIVQMVRRAEGRQTQ